MRLEICPICVAVSGTWLILTALVLSGYLNSEIFLPLVIILFIAGDKKILEKVKSWQQKERGRMRLLSGLTMIVLGLIIFLF